MKLQHLQEAESLVMQLLKNHKFNSDKERLAYLTNLHLVVKYRVNRGRKEWNRLSASNITYYAHYPSASDDIGVGRDTSSGRWFVRAPYVKLVPAIEKQIAKHERNFTLLEHLTKYLKDNGVVVNM